MKKNLLISTVGKNPHIIHSLEYVTSRLRIGEAIYLVSSDDEVKKTYEKIAEENKNWGIESSMISIHNPESIKEILDDLEKSGLKEKIKKIKEQGGLVYVDFTYGTKPLSSALVFYSFSYYLFDELVYITGTRDKKGIVVSNFNLQLYSINQLFWKRWLADLSFFVKNFDYKNANKIIESFTKTETIKIISKFLDYFSNFLKGDFKKLLLTKNDLFLFRKVFGNLINLLEKSNEEIKEYDDLRKKNEKTTIDDSKKRLLFEIKYFSDLMEIYYQKAYYPQVLAFFNSLLDKYLTLRLIDMDYDQEGIIFDPKKNSYLKKTKEEEKVLGVFFKLNEYVRLIKAKKEKINEKEIEEVKKLIQKRNESLFGHGFYFPDEKDAEKALSFKKYIIKDLKLEPLFRHKDKDYFFYYPLEIDFSSIMP